MSYIEEIESFLKSREALGIQPGLERMEALLSGLGHPEKSYPSVHVAGTNGKGSTVSMLAKALQTTGLKVGRFISPSYIGLTGHIYIDENPIDDKTLALVLKKIKPLISTLDKKGLSPSSFEILTAISFYYFSLEEVDIAIFEAGMGGRFDTTNCIEPLCTIITSVAIDHEGFLGSSLAEVAWHKAGIIKKQRPVIVGDLPTPAEEVITREALALEAPIYIFGKDFTLEGDSFKGIDGQIKRISLGLKGHHQKKNLSLVLLCLQLLEKDSFLSIPWKKMQTAFHDFSLPGRFEKISSRPTIYVDSAHNLEALKALIETIKISIPDRPVEILFSAFSDKQVEEMVELLHRTFSNLTLTSFSHPRAVDSVMMEALAKSFDQVDYTEDWQLFLSRKRLDQDADSVLLVTGSLQFISLVRDFLLQKNE